MAHRRRHTVLSAGFLCALCALCASVASLPGCSSTPDTVEYAKAYPREVLRGRTLDIQVFRENQEIEFTNTTAHAYPAGTLWLNGRFSRPLDTLAVGQTIKLPLREFRDEYSEPFRAGGFFAKERPDRLVLAQLETTGSDGNPVMLGFVVVGTGNEE